MTSIPCWVPNTHVGRGFPSFFVSGNARPTTKATIASHIPSVSILKTHLQKDSMHGPFCPKTWIADTAFNPVQCNSIRQETIRWLTWEQVPNFITKGPYKGQGLGDSLTQAIQDKLPQYNHKNLVVNASRYNRLIKKEDICVAWAWIVPGSEEYRIHSRPVSLAPQTGIYVPKQKAYKFGKAGTRLSLKTLLSNSDLRLGVLKDMPYTKKVHDLLNQYEGKPNLFMSSVKEVEFDFKMLDGNRVDYFFGFPSQAIANERIKKIKNNYQFYNIEEINLYPSMYAHCSKTPFG